MTDAQKQFIETVGALVQADAAAARILPSVTIAQAILESGWGKSALTRKANALFGIKADKNWTGPVYASRTKECYDGVRFTKETACFRAYADWAESIADHGAFLCGLSRYRNVIGEDNYRAACIALQQAGYATDPDYAGKLIGLIERFELTRFDQQTVYTVQRGDTLTKIARRFDTTVDGLVEANRTKYPRMTRDYIQAGWVLRI